MYFTFSTFIVLVMGVIFQYILMERRFDRKITILIIAIGVSIVFALNAVFFISTDISLYIKRYPLTVNLPVFLLFIYLSKHRGFQMVFNLLTAVFLCCIISISGFVLSSAFNNSELATVVGRIAAFPPLLLFVVKVFRPLYMEMLDKLKKGWALFCLIPLCSYALLYFLTVYPAGIQIQPGALIRILLALTIVIASYAVICVFFRQMQRHFAIQSEQQLLKSQVDALQNQLTVVSEVDQRTKILRHDLHHNMQNITVLLQKGDNKSALEFIGKYDELLDQATIPRYCMNPTINSILTHYLENAKKEGITIRARLDIPEKIPFDEMELCIVFANAIENARQACHKLPYDADKSIELICVSKPHFLIETANPYWGTVLFDKDDLPVSKEKGHGIGTQSIAAFVKKHNALLDYQTENGIFRLRIVLA